MMPPRKVPSIITMMNDPNLFGGPFSRDPATWTAWRSFHKAVYALPMTGEEAAIYAECTGRLALPLRPHREVWACIGRRGGKSINIALLAAYNSIMDWSPFLSATGGERATVLVISQTKEQALVVMEYIRTFLAGTDLITRSTRLTLELSNRVQVKVATASFRSTRGFTIAVCIVDEIAYFRGADSANPDGQILDAVRPALATTNGMLICASSPAGPSGAMFEAHKAHHGRNGDPVLSWQAPTWVMNPSLPEDSDFISDAFDSDPISASCEYGAQFRDHQDAFITRDTVEPLIDVGVDERQPVGGQQYVAFVDAASGSGKDAAALAIAHLEKDADNQKTAILDLERIVKPPFSPTAIVEEFAGHLRRFGITTVVGDKFAPGLLKEAFAKHGITYKYATQTRSEIYLSLVPLLTSGMVRLLDAPTVISQLCALQRRPSATGRDQVNHPRGGKDDAINAVAGALVLAAARAKSCPMVAAISVNTGEPNAFALTYSENQLRYM